MATKTTIVCDVTGAEGAVRISGTVGCSMDPSGNGTEFDWATLDISPELLTRRINNLLLGTKFGLNYDQIRAFLNYLRNGEAAGFRRDFMGFDDLAKRK